nr:hypothetical protein [Tanacetum cinerariifolium]
MTALQPHSSGVEIQDLPCSIIKDKYMMKAQQVLKGRLLASFQDLEHEGGDTRSQGGIKDNVLKIKIQDHRRTNDESKKFPRTQGSNPYIPLTVVVQAGAATDDSLAIPEHTTMKYTRLLMLAKQLKKCGKLSKGYNKPEWSRFVMIVKQQHKLDEVSYHNLFDILKQYLKEVNELCAERLARNANPLALVATDQANQDPYYQTSKSRKSYASSSNSSILSRSHTTTKYKGKEIAKPITPPSESASEKENDPEQAQRDKDMQKNLALITKYFKRIYKPTNNNLRTSSNSRNKNVDTTSRYKNDNQSGQFGNQRTMNVAGKYRQKLKRVKDSAYHKEKMLLCKQAKKGVSLQAEKYDWLTDTDEEIDEQELEAHYMYMAKIPEVPIADSGIDSEPKEHVQNDTGYNVFANELQHSEQSESISNTCLVETNDSNVIPDSPDILIPDGEETLAFEGESQSKLNKDSMRPYDYTALNKIVDNAWVKHTKDQFHALTAKDMEILIQTCLMPLALKTQNGSFIFVHELKQEMHADLKYVESLKKEIDELQYDKVEFSNMYDMIFQECVSNEVICSYLLSLFDLDALAELQCLYLPKVKEFWNEQASNVFRKEREQYIKIQDLKAQLQDKNIAINDLKKLIEKGKGKFVETKFDKPSVVRQPNAQRIPKPSVLGKLAPFSDSLETKYLLKTKSVPKTNVSEGLSKTVTAQTLPQTARQAVSNINVLKLGMYRIDNRTTQTIAPQSSQNFRNTNPRVSTSTGVNHKTNVSRPKHRSNQMKDKVMQNKGQVKLKKTQVEDHLRIPSISNKIKSVTTSIDSLNSRTLNVNAVYATCEKCLVNSDHFACVTKLLNDMNARTKKPNVVPISTRKPKGHANKSVATPHKKKVASKCTTQKTESYYRMLYKKTGKAWKW